MKYRIKIISASLATVMLFLVARSKSESKFNLEQQANHEIKISEQALLILNSALGKNYKILKIGSCNEVLAVEYGALMVAEEMVKDFGYRPKSILKAVILKK